jgi:hypothetical protein
LAEKISYLRGTTALVATRRAVMMSALRVTPFRETPEVAARALSSGMVFCLSSDGRVVAERRGAGVGTAGDEATLRAMTMSALRVRPPRETPLSAAIFLREATVAFLGGVDPPGQTIRRADGRGDLEEGREGREVIFERVVPRDSFHFSESDYSSELF